MRLLVVAICCFAVSGGITAAQAAGGAGARVADPGTSPTPGPTNPSLPSVVQVPPDGVRSGSRGLTGNDEAQPPPTPEEAGPRREKPVTQ